MDSVEQIGSLLVAKGEYEIGKSGFVVRRIEGRESVTVSDLDKRVSALEQSRTKGE
jgi:hypothetical protein